MSVAAVTWVMHEAPDLPPHLFGTLFVLANNSQDGKYAFASMDYFTRVTRKTPEQIRADLYELVTLGLIRPGDQSVVEEIPPRERPQVFDLALELTRENK